MPAALIAIVVIALFGVGAYFITNESGTEVPSESEIARTPDETPVETAAEADEMTGDDAEVTASAAQPMTYNATASYLTPARDEHDVGVTLEVDAEGIITSADVDFNDGGGYSNSHQERFDQAFQDEVIGRPISDVELSSTGGASLTSAAFNEAVAEIRAQVG